MRFRRRSPLVAAGREPAPEPPFTFFTGTFILSSTVQSCTWGFHPGSWDTEAAAVQLERIAAHLRAGTMPAPPT